METFLQEYGILLYMHIVLTLSRHFGNTSEYCVFLPWSRLNAMKFRATDKSTKEHITTTNACNGFRKNFPDILQGSEDSA